MKATNNNLPDIIRQQHDGVRFCFWLAEHPEITNIQGWELSRYESGTPSSFGTHYADVTWLWSERKALNDWIRTYRNRAAN